MEDKINFGFTTTQKVINIIGYIDSFKGKWNSIEKKENYYLKELKRIATIESIGSSTRIEGAKLSDEEIEKLLNNVKITKFETRDEQEVVGYYKTLDIIFENYQDINLTENYIAQLYGILLKESQKDQRHRGKYKQLTNKVVATYPNGTQKTIFNTTEPHLVSSEMNVLIEWVKLQSEKELLHPLIIIGTLVYEFLSIHPFQDGNGRLSRLITTFLLLKYDYLFIQYISFEHIIERRKKDYYKALIDGQKHRYSKKEKIDKWILFFLSCIEELILKLEKKYDSYEKKGKYLNNRQKLIFELIKDHASLKVSDITRKLEKYSINTIKKDLQYLTSEKVIEKFGKGRGTIYTIKE